MKDRQFTILNLFGLSTGLACTILIYLWVSDEMQVDRFNEKDKQLFQIIDKYSDCTSNILVGDVSLVKWIRLPGRSWHRYICDSSYFNDADHDIFYQFPINKSSCNESNKKFKGRIKPQGSFYFI